MSRTPNPNEFLVFPIVDLDLMVLYRGSDISRPLYVPYSKFIAFITANITPASALLLQTNGTDNGSQTLLNLIQGSGITIADDGLGGITISASGGGSITADNGLTLTGSNVQLGGTLIQDTTITNSTFDLIITGTPSAKADYSFQVITTSGSGGAQKIDAFKQGIEVISGSVGISIVSGTAALTTKGQLGNQHTLVDGSATSLISSFTKEFLSLAASNGDGLIIAFLLANPLTNPNSAAGQISFLYTDASLGRVKFALAAADQQGSGNIICLEGHYNGSVVMPQYGIGTFTGTAAYNLAVDASGNVIEVSLGGSGIASINTDTTSAQTLSIGSGGTAPNWVDDLAGDHELNIPLASVSGVTAGLVSHSQIKSLSDSSFPYVERQYYTALGNSATALVKVPATDVLFMSTVTSDRVTCWDTATGELLSETVVSNPSGMLYVANGNSAGVTQGEVLVFTSSTTVFTFVAATGVLIGSQVIAGLSSNIKGCVDLSTISNKVYGYASGGAINILDVSAAAYTRTSYLMAGTGVGTFELQYITSGNHSGLIVGCSQNGIWAYDPTLNTVAISPTTLGVLSSAYSIKHLPLLDQYVVCGYISRNVVLVDADSATTFALNTEFPSIAIPTCAEVDPVTNLAYVSTYSGVTNTNIIITTFDMNASELKIVRAKPIASNQTTVSYMSPDYTNKAIYVVGSAGSSIPCKLIYSE
jgi:hypothetical protein